MLRFATLDAYLSVCCIKDSIVSKSLSNSKVRSNVGYATKGRELMQKVKDLRVRRTRVLLQKALIELTIQRGFTDLTVRDISERAMVNRSTFYRHYLDKYDLLRQYIVECYEILVAENDPTQAAVSAMPDQSSAPPAALIRVLKHVQQNADFYRVILGKQGEAAFYAESIRHYIERQIRGLLPESLQAAALQAVPHRPPLDLTVNYVMYAGIGAIKWWLENEQAYTLDQIAYWLNQLSQANVNFSLGLDG
jgi:AcrR family transcriptional regulator